MTNKYYKKLILGLMVMAFLVLARFQSVVKVEAKVKDGNYYEYYSGVKDSSGIYKMRLWPESDVMDEQYFVIEK